MAEFTVDFILMIIGMCVFFTVLVIIPLSWVPSLTVGLLFPQYELTSDCSGSDSTKRLLTHASSSSSSGTPSSDIAFASLSSTWFIDARKGFCNEAASDCISYNDGQYWNNLDELNENSQIESDFTYGSLMLSYIEISLLLCFISACIYVSGFLIMMFGMPKIGMITQGVTLFLMYMIMTFIYYIENHVDQINNPIAWETAVFTSCKVEITPSIGYAVNMYMYLTLTLLFGGTLFVSVIYYFFNIRLIEKLTSFFCCNKNNNDTYNDEEAALLASNKTNYSDAKKVLILMSATGGGHRMSAEAISTALINLYGSKIDIEILDIWANYANFPFTDVVNHYRLFSSYPWLWKISYDFTQFPITRLLSEIIAHMTSYDNFKKAIFDRNPDVIISVHPLCQHMPNMIVNELNQKRLKLNPNTFPTVFATVVTDLITAHASWFSEKSHVTFAPTIELRDMAIAYGGGIQLEHFIVHGLPIRPVFWNPSTITKENMREKLNLNIDVKTVLLMAGGDGVGAVKDQTVAVAKALGETSYQSQIIVICGHNKSMAADLRDPKRIWPDNVNVIVLGFTTNIDEYMVASNLLITKAGPGTICEAMILGLPLILSSFLPGQEEGNVPYVVNNGLGYYTEIPHEIAYKTVEMLSNDKLLLTMREKSLALARPEATLNIGKDIGKICFRTNPKFDRDMLR